MARRFKYSIPQMTRRLLHIAAPVKGTLAVSTLASIVGNLAQMGLMGFGALMLMSCAGIADGSPITYGVLAAISAALIVAGRYTEGVVSHAGAYRLLSDMRNHLFQTIRRLAPACLMDREKGDILNIAVSDIETIEFFFTHTIGPMFTVIILPCVTLGLALWFHPLFAAVLLPVYIIVSVIFPLIAGQAGRGVGMRYRKRLGEMSRWCSKASTALKTFRYSAVVKGVCRRCRRKTRRSTKKRTALPCTGRTKSLRRHSLYTWRVFWSSAPLHILRYPAYPSLSTRCFCLLWRQRRFLRHNL